MAARAIWKGVIRFGHVRVPVKLYSAVQDQKVHFRLLHDRDLVRLKQRMVNPKTDEALEYSEAQRGFEFDRERVVMLDSDELAELQPEASRDIRIHQFVDPEQINVGWYDRPYYLGPDDSDDDYFALAKALRRQEKEGLVMWVMRNRRYLGALRAEGDYLMLVTMRHAEEIIEVSELEPPAGKRLSPKEHRLAEQLIGSLQDDFRSEEFHDEYRERVWELIEAKRSGREFEPETYEEKAAPESLAGALEASLQQAR